MQNTDGFIAGTLIHTKDGIRPISEIKVGDWLLSHIEDPTQRTERDYKRVNRIFEFHNQRIVQFCWCRNVGDGEFGHAFSTQNPLVWSHPQGWVPIGNVPYTSAGSEEWFGRNLVLADGSVGERYEINPVYTTNKWEIAYLEADGEPGYVNLALAPHQFLLDYVHEGDECREDQDSDEWSFYTSTVFHLEVEDWHTFFIGKTGLLVHDATRIGTPDPRGWIDQDYHR